MVYYIYNKIMNIFQIINFVRTLLKIDYKNTHVLLKLKIFENYV